MINIIYLFLIIGSLFATAFLVFIFITCKWEKKFTKNHLTALIIVLVCYLTAFGVFPNSIEIGKFKIVFFKSLVEQLDQQATVVQLHAMEIEVRPTVGGIQ